MSTVVDRLPGEACPTCVASIESGGSPGPLGASHDVPGVGTCTLAVERVSDETFVSLGPCPICSSSASVLRRAVWLVLLTVDAPAWLGSDAEDFQP